ncbi:MAG: type II toxin-antitoxin system VapC family toxin [Candidatus Hydrothermarchaeota archaeon]
MHMEFIYLDTNIYLDYWYDRKDRLRPLGEFAFSILMRVIDCEFIIIISDLLLKELSTQINEKAIEELFSDLKAKDKLITSKIEEKDIEDANELKRKYPEVPFPDLLHYTKAINTNARYLITRDEHYDLLPEEKILIRKPEEL